MESQKPRKADSPKKSHKRIIWWILAVVVAVIVLVLIVVPAVVSSNKGRQMVLERINDSVDGRADISDISMSWWSGINITDFSFEDGAGTKVNIKNISTKPHYLSIMMGNMSFGKTILDQPNVEFSFKQPRSGTVTAVESVPAEKGGGEAGEIKAPAKSGSVIIIPVERIDLKVKDGSVKVTDESGKTVKFSRINSTLGLRPPGEKTKFDLNMAVEDKQKDSDISVDGYVKTAKSKKGWSLKGTSGDLAVEVNELDLKTLAPFFELAGVDIQAQGKVSANIKNKINKGRLESSVGTIRASNVLITGPALKGDRLQSSLIDVAIDLAREKDMINIKVLNIKTDWLEAKALGKIPTSFGSLEDFLKSKSDLTADFTFDVGRIMSQMPHAMGAKEDLKLTSGLLKGSVKTVTQTDKRSLSGQLSLAGLAGSVGGKAVSLSKPIQVQALISSRQGKIYFDRLDMSSAFASADLTGTADDFTYKSQVDLAAMMSEIGQLIDTGGYNFAGQVVQQGTAKTKNDKMTLVGSSKITNLRITSPAGVTATEPSANVTYNMQLDKSSDMLRINSIKTVAGFGQVEISNSLVPMGNKSSGDMNLNISATAVNLAMLRPFAVMLAGLPSDMQLSGIADSQVNVTQKGSIYNIVSKSTRIRNLSLRYPNKEPFSQSEVTMTFDVQADPTQKLIDVRSFELISPQIKIRKGTFKQQTNGGQTRVQGRADLEYDWSVLSSMIAGYLPQGLKIYGQRRDQISFSSSYPEGQAGGLMANLNTSAAVGFTKADYKGLYMGPTNLSINVNNGVLTIAPFSTVVNNGKFNFAAGANFNRKPSLLTTPGPMQMIQDVQINDEMAKQIMPHVNPIFADAIDPRGIVNFNCEKMAIPVSGGNRNDIEVVGTVSVTNMRVQSSALLTMILEAVGGGAVGQNITIRPSRFVLRDGFLRYDDMQVDVGNNPINFKGVIGLDRSLNMTVLLPPLTLKRLPIKVDNPLEGKRISVPLKGTLDKPELDLGKLTQGLLEQQGGELLRRGLEEIDGLEGLQKLFK